MCGRFAQTTDFFKMKNLFDIDENIIYEPNFNLSPGQNIPALVLFNNRKKLEFHRWGLITEWSKKENYNMINIRKESLFEKNFFRNLLLNNRCLIIADGFYEWEKQSNKKIPYYFFLKDSSPFAFAGIWNIYYDGMGNEIKSCAIITTEPNSLIAKIHDRMPAIVPIEKWDLWLNIEKFELSIAKELLGPYPSELMSSYQVSSYVNNTKNNSILCIKPVKVENDDLFFNKK